MVSFIMTKEETLVRRVRYAVIGAMVLLVSLVCFLGFQYAIMARNNATEARLAELYDSLTIQINTYENRITYMESQEFIEYFALRYMGWGRPGSVIFATP